MPNSTLWVTRPRSDVNVQTSPWVAKSAFSQGGTAQRIFGINNGLGSTFASQVSVSMATIPDGDTQSAHNYLTDLGNYQGTFQGDVANNTGTFTQPVRSDLYELRPASGNPDGRYLGYFELSPNGGMSFNSAFTAVPEPSTYAIAVGAALVVFGAFRRRARQSSE